MLHECVTAFRCLLLRNNRVYYTIYIHTKNNMFIYMKYVPLLHSVCMWEIISALTIARADISKSILRAFELCNVTQFILLHYSSPILFGSMKIIFEMQRVSNEFRRYIWIFVEDAKIDKNLCFKRKC